MRVGGWRLEVKEERVGGEAGGGETRDAGAGQAGGTPNSYKEQRERCMTMTMTYLVHDAADT